MFIANNVSIRSPICTVHKYTEHIIAQKTKDDRFEKLRAIGARCKQLADTQLQSAEKTNIIEPQKATMFGLLTSLSTNRIEMELYKMDSRFGISRFTRFE